jgi:hypothetical protein
MVAHPPKIKGTWWAKWARILRRIHLGLTICVGAVLLVGLVGLDRLAPQGHARVDEHLVLYITPNKPYAARGTIDAYVPTTVLSVPAHSLVTVTIVNFDLSPVPSAGDAEAAAVRGTLGGIARADGRLYTALDWPAIAHTFTVPLLGLSVPIPSRAPDGGGFVVVTFQFRTDAAGTYVWRCLAPCSDDAFRLGGTMADDPGMHGKLTVVG